MLPMVVLRSVGSWVWKRVRSSPETGPTDRTPSLTIGALHVSNDTPRALPDLGIPTSRRQLGYEALLHLAADLLIARFALTRALDRLPTEELLQVLDEVDETLQSGRPAYPRPTVTPRSQK